MLKFCKIEYLYYFSDSQVCKIHDLMDREDIGSWYNPIRLGDISFIVEKIEVLGDIKVYDEDFFEDFRAGDKQFILIHIYNLDDIEEKISKIEEIIVDELGE